MSHHHTCSELIQLGTEELSHWLATGWPLVGHWFSDFSEMVADDGWEKMESFLSFGCEFITSFNWVSESLESESQKASDHEEPGSATCFPAAAAAAAWRDDRYTETQTSHQSMTFNDEVTPPCFSCSAVTCSSSVHFTSSFKVDECVLIFFFVLNLHSLSAFSPFYLVVNVDQFELHLVCSVPYNWTSSPK